MGYSTAENNSFYVKSYLQNELYKKSMARSLDKGVTAFGERFRGNLMDTIGSVSDGMGRLMGEGVCLFLNNNHTCDMLRQDDLRMMTCIKEFLERTDAILDMLYLCIVYVLQRYDDKMQLRILAKVTWFLADCKHYSSPLCGNLALDEHKIVEVLKNLEDPIKRDEVLEHLIGESIYPITTNLQKMTMGLAAKMATDMVAENILAYAAAQYIAGSQSLSQSIKTALSRWGGAAVSIFSSYGNITKAVTIAEKLKSCNPKLYHLLYINNLEMFFFLFEEHLPQKIYQGDYAFATEEDAITFFKEMIK
ncbi:hypothetical protein RHD99_21780 [Buttiauxella selenatireducens]|uniref:Uncharacterized protein n=1 Tax=Buttiauxella selenatireducens TaxID=3073902 RepID=A0ABY9S944_9ENTR|nr:hypothetical protein [Buttiauxella sp. R73]WMY74029.1 hypothetical protein RHD99_21780 [Buttiauxella sp. R73]